MEYQSYFYVFVIFLFLNNSQMVSGQNIGLVVRNLTHLPSNESCGSGGRDCRYYMHLCFSFSEKLDCSIFTLTTLTWLVRPGDSKIIKLYQYVARNTVNPLRVALSKWKMQKVVLEANVTKTGTPPTFIERIEIRRRLPHPINDLSKLEDNKITECGREFCLGVALYMWCDDTEACKEINPTTPTIPSVKTTSTSTTSTSSTPGINLTTSPVRTTSTTSTVPTPGINPTTSTIQSVKTTSTSITSTSSTTGINLTTSPVRTTATTSTVPTPGINPTTSAIPSVKTTSTIRTSTSSTPGIILTTSPVRTTTTTSTVPTPGINPTTSAIPSVKTTSTIRTSTSSTPGIILTTSPVRTTATTSTVPTQEINSATIPPEYGETSSDTKVVSLWWMWMIVGLVILVPPSVLIWRYKKRSARLPITKKSEHNYGTDVELSNAGLQIDTIT